jgi:hypothetical protein
VADIEGHGQLLQEIRVRAFVRKGFVRRDVPPNLGQSTMDIVLVRRWVDEAHAPLREALVRAAFE